MALKGDLDSVDLAQVFQVLRGNQKVGVLVVTRADRRCVLRFSERGVALQVDPAALEERIVEALRRRGEVTDEALRLALATRSGPGGDLLGALVGIGAVSADRLEETSRDLLGEDLYDVFSWRAARFEFIEGASRLEDEPGTADDRFAFPPDSVVMEAARRLDEWGLIRAHVPDRGEVFTVRPGAPFAPRSPIEAEVLALVDGIRPVQGILDASTRSALEVEKAILGLLLQGRIEPLSPSAYASAGKRALAAGRPSEAAHLFERAAGAGANAATCLGAAARSSREAREFASAVRFLRRQAEAYAARGALREAVAALREAVALVPTDLLARERLVGISLAVPPHERGDFDPGTEGRALAGILLELDQGSRSRSILDLLLAANPSDFETKRLLVAALTRLGERKPVLALYESIAEDLAPKDPLGAVRYLQKILLVDRARPDVTARIRSLYRRDERRRARRRRLAALVAVALVLVSAAGLYSLYEGNARAALAALDFEGPALRGDVREGEALLESFRRRFPLTIAAARARDEFERVRSLADRRRMAEEARHRASAATEEARRVEVDRVYSEALAKAGSGRLLEAKRLLEEALADPPPSWKAAADARAQLHALDAYFAGASDLASRADALEEAGDLESAREARRGLLAQYPDAPPSRSVLLPFRIESHPPGASLVRDGAVLPGTTPLTVSVPPSSSVDLELVRLGFELASLTVDPAGEDPTAVRLLRAPDLALAAPAPPVGNPLRVEGLLLLPATGGRLFALDVASGRVRWSLSLGRLGEIADVSTKGDRLFYAGTDGSVAAVRLSDGGRLWSVATEGFVRAAPLPVGDRVFVGSGDGSLYALGSENGTEHWRALLGASIGTGVLLVDSVVVAASGDGRVHAVDSASGKVQRVWELGASPAGLLAGPEATALALSTEGRLYAIEPVTGHVRFATAPLGMARTGPRADGETVVFAAGGALWKVEGRSGEVLARARLPATEAGPPSVAGNGVFVLDVEGDLRFFESADLGLRWKARRARGSHGPSGFGSGAFVAESSAIYFYEADLPAPAPQPSSPPSR